MSDTKDISDEEKIRLIRAKKAAYAREYYHNHKVPSDIPKGRPKKKIFTEEEQILKKQEADKLRYEKNRELLLQKSSDYYKMKIGGEYKYRSKNSNIVV